MKRNLGDEVYFNLDLSPLFGSPNGNAYLLQLMTLEMPDLEVDPQRNVVIYKGQEIHLKELGLVEQTVDESGNIVNADVVIQLEYALDATYT